MIARTKVNYNLVDLLRAMVVSEQKLDARNRVKQLLLSISACRTLSAS